MADISSGIFIFMLVFGFGFMLFAFKAGWPFSPYMRFVSMAIFMGVAVLLASGYGVSSTEVITDGTTTWNDTKQIIPSGGPGIWMNYIFLGFVILNLFFTVREIWIG